MKGRSIMNFLNKLLEWFDTGMEIPSAYGAFHILFLTLSIAATVFLCMTHKKGDSDRLRHVVFATAIIVLILEIYKQINYTFLYGESITADYQWYAFPWQFCSTPMYAGLLAGILKKGKVYDALISYLGTYALFAGLCVMIYPNDVFCETLGINIQTMVCHGSMISIGIYILYTKSAKFDKKTILGAMAVFAAAMSVAMVLNEIAYFAGITEAEGFNMFYISPHDKPHLILYSSIQEILPFPICIVIYFLAFSLAAYLILLTSIYLKKIDIKTGKTKKCKQ